MHAVNDSRSREERAEYGQRKGCDEKAEIPHPQHSAALLHQNRVDVRRSRQPGKEACVLNRVPGPHTTPSKNLVTPPTAKQDADGQQAPCE